MDKLANKDHKIKDCSKVGGTKEYVRPELTKREKATKVIGGTPVITS